VRVLMISKACVVGSYQKKLEELACLPDLELTVAVPPFWRDERGILPLERQHTSGYDLRVLPMALNGSFHLHFYPSLGRHIRDLQPDLVHIDEEPYNLAAAQALWLARRWGARALFFSWQNLLRRYPPPFCLLERYVLRHADCAIVGNCESADVWRAKGYTGPLAVIPQFGVDPDLYAPQPRRPNPQVVVGYVGRLVEEKGVDLLLEALAGLEGEWQARILGSGPAESALRSQAEGAGLAGRVSFDGWIPSSALPAYYRHLDVLVVPSRTLRRWKEQFGRVLIEAMACGVPVVGAHSGEIPHVIGDAGLIFPEGDAAALRAHLACLVHDPDLRDRLAVAGRARVAAHFTQAQIAARTYEVYQALLWPSGSDRGRE
jgi:glycosyltransferase involved in cell wall biosynthesis